MTRRAAALPRIVELDATRSGLLGLRCFYEESYVAQFPDPDERESLEQLTRYLKLKAAGGYGANNYHVLVALDAGAPVGGVILDYLALPDSGMIEFLFVNPPLRGSGLGRRLLDAALRCLRGDARACGNRLAAVAAEMNDPFRRPARPDNMDPFVRAATWGRWGFSQLLCPYAQPALSADQRAVDYLTLIVRPLQRPSVRSVAADWVRALVAEYMRWAMRIRAPQRQPVYQRLDAYLASRRRVALLPLQASIGDDAQRPFDVRPVDETQRAFSAVVRLARRAVAVPGHAAAPEVYRAAFAAMRRGGPTYHLWSIAAPGRTAVQGLASFFSLASVGFGGYVVLDEPLRGRGLLAPLLARMEARMMADGVASGVAAPGWLIECADDSAPIFMRRGFAEVPLDYRPPSIETAPGGPTYRLHLLYKPFGAAYPPLRLKRGFLLRALREIFVGVYGIAAPTRYAGYRRCAASLVTDSQGDVWLHHWR